MPGVPKKVQPEILEKIRALGSRRRSIQEMADLTGLSWATVAHVVRNNNIPHKRTRRSPNIPLWAERALSGDPESLFIDEHFVESFFPAKGRRGHNGTVAEVQAEGGEA